jgi:enoyl-CoA hydratase/carnithine racemase
VFGRSAFESALERDRRSSSARTGSRWWLTGKPYIFAAGADIEEFPKLRTREEAVAGSRVGHELFGRIRALRFPTVAAINGVWPRRRARDRAVLLGAHDLDVGPPLRLPGGLPRHPARMGRHAADPAARRAESAIRVVVSNPLRQNKLIDARKAVELGFADKLLDPVEFVDESIAYALELAESPRKRGGADTTIRDDLCAEPARRSTTPSTAPHARPYVALDLIELACSGDSLETACARGRRDRRT